MKDYDSGEVAERYEEEYERVDKVEEPGGEGIGRSHCLDHFVRMRVVQRAKVRDLWCWLSKDGCIVLA